ncbi:MAG: hypothetical protein WC372_09550, partial [Candidatus Neomarinimicrobiota bacterium]
FIIRSEIFLSFFACPKKIPRGSPWEKQKKDRRFSPLAKNPLRSVKYLKDSLRSPKYFLTLTHRIFLTRRRDAA